MDVYPDSLSPIKPPNQPGPPNPHRVTTPPHNPTRNSPYMQLSEEIARFPTLDVVWQG